MIQTEPNSVYVIGAASFWMERFKTTDHDRERRVFAVLAKKRAKRFQRERERMEKLMRPVN